MRALANSPVLLATLLACRAAAPTSERPEPAAAEPVTGAPVTAAGCRLTLASSGAPAGPVFVLVDGVGVLELADGQAQVVVPLAGEAASATKMVAGPQGELWLSDWGGVRVLAPDGGLRPLRTVRDGPRYEHMVVRSARDVWAVSSDIEWEVVHYDGARWTTHGRRAQFPGRYSDNKFNGMAVTGEGVWVWSWNGLWRLLGGEWTAVALPEALGVNGEVWTYHDRPIVGGPGGHFLREGAGWRALAWPSETSVRRALAEVGVVAAPHLDRPTLALRGVEGEGCTRESEAIAGGGVDAFVVDEAGRSWVSSGSGLAVLDAQGRLLAQWGAGALPGLTGRVRAIAAVGAGPARLPAAQAGRTWELIGRLTLYKSGKPLAGAEIELCSATGRDGQCVAAPFTPVSLRARTGADGSFRLVGAPEGELYLLVRPPAGLADCDSPFTVVGDTVTPARDCAGATGVCDLGELVQCLPFEMPPG